MPSACRYLSKPSARAWKCSTLPLKERPLPRWYFPGTSHGLQYRSTKPLTEKKEHILQTALRLFSEQGYERTPTSQIAREAGVSEGLIFRHFQNKEGLLAALISLGKSRLYPLMEQVLAEQNPRTLLAQVIDLPVKIISQEKAFWRLQMSLKQIQGEDAQNSFLSLQPLYLAVVQCFQKLGFAEAETEAQLLFLTLDGLSKALMAESAFDPEPVIQLLKARYQQG
ncbi:MAG: TetR/AcrR family transcriptional regulator [Bacteroidetes bacterium]|nr:MAG: TetR/AcrR family transcriptional regulator [Bacteroidota bacterium]